MNEHSDKPDKVKEATTELSKALEENQKIGNEQPEQSEPDGEGGYVPAEGRSLADEENALDGYQPSDAVASCIDQPAQDSEMPAETRAVTAEAAQTFEQNQQEVDNTQDVAAPQQRDQGIER